MSQLEYRFGFVMWSITSVLWILLTLISIEFIFGHVNSIAGWTKDQMLLVATIYGLITSIMWMFVLPSIIHFTRLVSKGTLDFYLLKPINNRFLLSVHEFDLDNFLRVFILTIIFFNLINILKLNVSPITWIEFIIVIFLGLGIFYNLFFTVAITSIWFIDIFNLEDLYANTLNIGRFPTQAFKGAAQFIFVFIIPAIFLATFPAQILLGTGGIETIILGAILFLLSFIISQRFWRFAINKYSSASS